eukprot:TRINITY_DN7659_c0_g1_i1.p2 TRINITY_DN7659_c0_g1~~TRINITY_DN7659_c0_g1_i1.p2  ORF type:complete len:244 (-),score=64.71 TRINITY_DN7659_c0_g1_i1:1218-1949(-)
MATSAPPIHRRRSVTTPPAAMFAPNAAADPAEIGLHPRELKFYPSDDVSLTETLLLQNLSQHPMSFAVQSTAPLRYVVRPQQGELPAGESIKITIKCVEATQRHADKFKVRTHHPQVAALRHEFVLPSTIFSTADEAPTTTSTATASTLTTGTTTAASTHGRHSKSSTIATTTTSTSGSGTSDTVVSIPPPRQPPPNRSALRQFSPTILGLVFLWMMQPTSVRDVLVAFTAGMLVMYVQLTNR